MYHAPRPEGIEHRKAYIVGGGIAGLAAAAFLADDAGMPGENITILEASTDVGGAMDGVRREFGYQCRGERELEAYMVIGLRILIATTFPKGDGANINE